MATLLGRAPASSYTELLKIGASNLSTVPSFIEDGLGNVSPLSIGTTQVVVSSTATSGFIVAAPTTISGLLTSTGGISVLGPVSFSQVTLTIANGTAPMTVTSSTLVTNLNANFLSGKTAPTGAIVGLTDTQTLTNKTISGSANTLSAIPQASITGAPAGAFVGTTDTQTLTNKTLGASNTFSAIPNTSITGLGTLSTQNANSVSITGGTVAGSTITGTIGGSTVINTTGAITAGATLLTGLRVVGSNRTIIYPLADGNAGQFISTDGAGNLSFVAGGGGGGGGLASVSADTAPVLGGNLDVATFSIVSSVNRNIAITPNGTGTTVITKVATPSAGTDAANKTYVDTTTSAITATSIGKDTAQWNASKLQGQAIAVTAPTNGQVLTYNSGTSSYTPANPPGGVATAFFGFKRTGATSTHLSVDYSVASGDSFVKQNYIDWLFGAYSSFSVNADGHLVATF